MLFAIPKASGTVCVRRIDAGVECIDVLLRAGADRSLRDRDGKTALDAAIEVGREECARALNLEMGDATVTLWKYVVFRPHSMTPFAVRLGGVYCIVPIRW